MTLAVVIFLLVIGSIIFHFASPWWFTELAADWGSIDFTMSVTFWVTGIVFVLLNLFLAYCIWKFRQKDGHKAVYEPENTKLELGLSAITTVGVVAMLAPGLFVWASFVTVPEDAMEFEILGQQWQWQFRYPGDDGVLGVVDTSLVSETNPFGVNPEDPDGQDDVIVNSPNMRLPMGQPMHGLLRSNDVLHNFTVAQFRVKMDLVPGLTSYLWFEPTREGTYDILCEELCGIGHFIMRGAVTVTPQEEFDAWLAEQPTFAETQSVPEPDLAAGQQIYAACATCHGQNGEGDEALNAPKLAGLQPWYIRHQLHLFQNGARGSHEQDVLGQQMVAFANMVSGEEAMRNVSGYIASFDNVQPSLSIQGDIDNGYDIYDRNCAACHLDDGSGTWYTDAPALTNQNDWYLLRQLQNFRAGIRGLHPEDPYGEQMVSMATAMANEEEMADVIAYLNQLSRNQ